MSDAKTSGGVIEKLAETGVQRESLAAAGKLL